MQCNKTLKIPIFSSSNLQREVTNINYAPKLSEKTGNGNLMLLPFLYFPMLARKLVFFLAIIGEYNYVNICRKCEKWTGEGKGTRKLSFPNGKTKCRILKVSFVFKGCEWEYLIEILKEK